LGIVDAGLLELMQHFLYHLFISIMALNGCSRVMLYIVQYIYFHVISHIDIVLLSHR